MRIDSLVEGVSRLTKSRLYRAKTLFALQRPLRDELTWLNETALAHLKNYQIWHHRHTIIEALASSISDSAELDTVLREEAAFVGEMFSKDSKNYHVWSYRQWLVEHFALWDSPQELQFVEEMLRQDVRNNSAWNHRWFVVFGRPDAPKSAEKDKAILERETLFAENAIRRAPQNQSPWSYLRGLISRFELPMSTVKAFAEGFASLDKSGAVKSSHALNVLADSYKEAGKNDEAGQALDLLANKYDPIRFRYWMWKKEQLGRTSA